MQEWINIQQFISKYDLKGNNKLSEIQTKRGEIEKDKKENESDYEGAKRQNKEGIQRENRAIK